eukprot:TRINITY_DN21988_c0_g1_i1.p1 TRINITY_DN21988_c0_g1~~TRINITY_DN21988_c0_g1_i1.p1  ORF type:complete len:377 (+),score=185.60 TRINITY_DN21988_c0_g1_i1:50-1132(+)
MKAITCVLLCAAIATCEGWRGRRQQQKVEEEEKADPYEVLGLAADPDTSDSEIKKTYKKLSRSLHPDVNRGQSDADKQRYKDVQDAYAILSDRKKRKVFDMMGHEGLKQLAAAENNGQRGNRGPFGMMFGGGDGGPEKGPDIVLTLRTTLDDVYNGAEHVVPLTKQKLKNFEVVRKCMKCKAQPATLQKVQIGPGMFMQQEVPPNCNSKCSASGSVHKKTVNMEVEIEAGVPEHHELVYELDADEYPDRLPGDVKFQVETAPHKVFRRKGNDLEMTLKVTLLEALVGFGKIVKHMDGHDIEIEREEPTPHGTIIRLEGEGMPKHHVPSERGVLVITVEVVFPSKVTKEQAEAFEKLLGED